MDERSERFIARGMAITLGLVYLYLIVSGIWKYVSTKDITNITWEIILIVMIPVSIGWFARRDESLLIPKMVTGNTYRQILMTSQRVEGIDITFLIHLV